MKKAKMQYNNAFSCSPKQIWSIETISRPIFISTKQRRFALLQSHNGKCHYCNQPLYIDSTVREATRTLSVKVSGYACQHCNLLFVKDASFLSEINSRIINLKELERKQQGLEKKKVYINGSQSFDDKAKIDTSEQAEVSVSTIPQLSTNSSVVYLYENALPCHFRGHQTENYHAYMTGLDENQEVGFYVEYCRKCNRFYMNVHDYKSYLIKLKLFPVRVDTTYFSPHHSNNPYGWNRAEMSPLRLNGYTVNASTGLSSDNRHRILDYIIDYGILEKGKVLEYLRMFIREQEFNTNMERAVYKWKEDIDHVLKHNLNQHPKINIARLVFKSKNHRFNMENEYC